MDIKHRYFLDVIDLRTVNIYKILESERVKFWNEHPNAKCIDEAEYNRLLKSSQ